MKGKYLALKKWLKKNPNYQKQWRQKNSIYAYLATIKYRQTEKGKQTISKSNAKRKRNLNWIQLFENPFDESEIIEWHHVTDAYVVAIPKDLHQLYYGKFHREKTMKITKQIYWGR